MFSRCLFCHQELEPNEALEHFPSGRKIAFDPKRGRLWAICGACQRWNLTPFEDRWEALEELEKLTRDRARLLAQTDNISLLRADGLEVVRVGNADLAEEAWWRYGRELLRRKSNYKLWTAAGAVVVAGVLAGGAAAGIGVFGGWYGLWRASKAFPLLGRSLKFGDVAWQGEARCARCGAEVNEIPFKHRGVLVPRPEPNFGVSLLYRCPRCTYPRRSGGSVTAAMDPESGVRLEGTEAEHVLRRILAYHHYSGADEAQVIDASKLIQHAGSARALSVRVAARRRELIDLDPIESFALEIAVNEEAERRLLELELAELEKRWKEEEEIAAIVDTELTWLPRIVKSIKG